jgi:hypothetical protein
MVLGRLAQVELEEDLRDVRVDGLSRYHAADTLAAAEARSSRRTSFRPERRGSLKERCSGQRADGGVEVVEPGGDRFEVRGSAAG